MPLGLRNPNLVNFCAAFGSQLYGPFFKETSDISDWVRIVLLTLSENHLPYLPSLIVPKSLNLTLKCGIIGLIYPFLGGLYLLTIVSSVLL